MPPQQPGPPPPGNNFGFNPFGLGPAPGAGNNPFAQIGDMSNPLNMLFNGNGNQFPGMNNMGGGSSSNRLNPYGNEE